MGILGKKIEFYRILLKKFRKLERKIQPHNKKYFIIRYGDKMHCGWSVWERVVLYNCIYASDYNMIPVVDMQSKTNIYLEEDEVGKVNAWEKYYLQPGGVSYEEAIESSDYIVSDESQEWFDYIRVRKYRLKDNEYLREQYQKYIKLNYTTKERCETNWRSILKRAELVDDSRVLGLCLRGTDYKNFNHAKNPTVLSMKSMIIDIMKKYKCEAIYIATEDKGIFDEICKTLSEFKLLQFNAGQLIETKGYIGDFIRQTKSADEASIEYLSILYMLNECNCLLGGICGATIVAQYKRAIPYDYFNIIDLKEHY